MKFIVHKAAISIMAGSRPITLLVSLIITIQNEFTSEPYEC